MGRAFFWDNWVQLLHWNQGNNDIALVEVASGKTLKVVPVDDRASVVRSTPDGKRAVVGTYDGDIRIVDLSTRKVAAFDESWIKPAQQLSSGLADDTGSSSSSGMAARVGMPAPVARGRAAISSRFSS